MGNIALQPVALTEYKISMSVLPVFSSYSFYLKNPNLQKGDETNSLTTYDDTIDMF